MQNPAGLTPDTLNSLENTSPDSKIILGSTWNKDRFGLDLRLTQFGETTRDFDFGGGFPDAQVYGRKWSLDTEVRYDVTEQWLFAVGADNLLDQYPDRSTDDIGYFGNLPYDVLSPIGVNGRYLYARTKINF